MAWNGVIVFDEPSKLTGVAPHKDQVYTQITVKRILDFPAQKKIVVGVQEVGRGFDLVTGVDYDTFQGADGWTYTQLVAKLKTVLGVEAASSSSSSA